jgi:(p)ppGpp synthase/HD superfamily hydrolase
VAFSVTYDSALVVAALAHRHQLRKGTRVPYVMHPFHVSTLLTRFGYGEPLTTAALLHDVLEDIPFEDNELQRDFALTFPQWSWSVEVGEGPFRRDLRAFLYATFGDAVSRMVEAVTEAKNDGGPVRPWIDRKREQLAHLANASIEVAVLKAADALHNVSTTVADVRSGRAHIKGRFKATPAETAWHYQEIARLARDRTGGAPIVDALDAAVADLTRLVST